MFTHSSLVRFFLSVAILVGGGVALQAAEVRVNVKGLDGRPANGVEVRIEWGAKGVALSGKTDPKGQYVFKKLDAGTYRVTVLAGKPPASLDTVQARDAGPVRVDFDLRAIAAGKKPRQFAWVLKLSDSWGGGRWVEMDAKGRLPAGTEQ